MNVCVRVVFIAYCDARGMSDDMESAKKLIARQFPSAMEKIASINKENNCLLLSSVYINKHHKIFLCDKFHEYATR